MPHVLRCVMYGLRPYSPCLWIGSVHYTPNSVHYPPGSRTLHTDFRTLHTGHFVEGGSLLEDFGVWRSLKLLKTNLKTLKTLPPVENSAVQPAWSLPVLLRQRQPRLYLRSGAQCHQRHSVGHSEGAVRSAKGLSNEVRMVMPVACCWQTACKPDQEQPVVFGSHSACGKEVRSSSRFSCYPDQTARLHVWPSGFPDTAGIAQLSAPIEPEPHCVPHRTARASFSTSAGASDTSA